jgi:hypothetical protein
MGATPTPREERLAKNEAVFRAANERMAAWDDRHAAGEDELYLCECSDPECRERLALTREQYEHVRADSRHFAVLNGHEIPDVEFVIEEIDNWVIVEKTPGVEETLEKSDPRA